MDTRSGFRSHVAAAAVFFLAALFTGPTVQSQPRTPRVPEEFETGRDYDGLTQRVSFDRSGAVWMATQDTLYRMQAGSLRPIANAARKGTQLVLAPGGGMYAWLVYDRAPRRLFTVQLVETPQRHVTELRLPDYPYGFSALYLGGAGQLIVSVSPLDNPEGLDGRFRYTFWDAAGQILGAVELYGRRKAVLDVEGEAILLLGSLDAIAFSSAGKQLWRLDGSYRMAALAAEGKVAFLNPSAKDAIDIVHVFRDGDLTEIALPAPVHDLTLAGDGSDGAVAIDRGRLVFVAPSSCFRQRCQLRPLAPLPVAGTYFISEARFIDRTTVAIAVIQRTSSGPPHTYPAGGVYVVSNTGQRMIDFPVTLSRSAPGRPLLDVTYGARTFATHTPHRAIFVDVGP